MNDIPSTPPQNKFLSDQFGNPLKSTPPSRLSSLITSWKAVLAAFAATIAIFTVAVTNIKTISETFFPTKTDLLISPASGSSYYTSLDGATPSHDGVLLGGAKLRFSLSHDHKSSDSIVVHTLAFSVTEFFPGENSNYSYKINAKLPYHGEARINSFRVEFTGNRMSSAVWIRDKKVDKVKAPSANILGLSPPLAFKLSSKEDDVESFEGTLVPITAGMYKVVCKIEYTVSGRNHVKELEPVNIYYEE